MKHIITTLLYLALLAPFISANIIQRYRSFHKEEWKWKLGVNDHFNFRSTNESFPYICFERDDPPVEIGQRFKEKCYDIEGNKYHENATLNSCCDCFM